jgi:RHS repeat-associated protein
VGQGEGKTVAYYHGDHLGSSNIITDANGAQVQYCEYTPYGTFARNELANPQTGKPVNHYFTGKELDNTGLYFYAWRYYDPTIGRYCQPDTIIPEPYNPQTLNRYSYCDNNPLNYTDPSGHFAIFAAIIGAIIGAITGAISAAAAGGDIWKGAAFGAVIGFISTSAAMFAKDAMMASFAGKIISPMQGGMITGVEFAIGGAGAGAISGFAGGAGNIGDIFRGAGIGALIGFGTGFAVGYSYTAGWQSIAHGADTANHNIGILKEGARNSLEAGDIASYDYFARELQQYGVDAPKVNDILGVYRDPNITGIYADNPVIYEKYEWHRLDNMANFFKPKYGAMGTVMTGEIVGGSTRALVYGVEGQPTSWVVQMMDVVKTDPSTMMKSYGWKNLPESQALKTKVATEAFRHFRK